jgi:hypothetical protein
MIMFSVHLGLAYGIGLIGFIIYFTNEYSYLKKHFYKIDKRPLKYKIIDPPETLLDEHRLVV